VDAVSVLGLGHIFTANMTGNVVFIGFAIAGTAGFSIVRSCIAVSGFLIGLLVGGRITSHTCSLPPNGWAVWTLIVDGLFLAAAAIASFWLETGEELGIVMRYCTIGLTALAMGVRNFMARRLGVLDLTTTVLTMTMVGLASDSFFVGGNNQRWRRRIAAVSAMLAGAFIGALLVKWSVPFVLGFCGVGSLAFAVSLRRQLTQSV
jgi:uncharacterized membrane protein YoaK (UPF0700 family)